MYKPPHQKNNAFIRNNPKMVSIEDTTAFPELIKKKAVEEVNMDFKAKLETAQVAEAKKPEPVTTKQKRWATPDEIMSALNENYLRWKADYIEEYGEEYYERYYRFQDYDYEYFDKLDEKLERELELEEEKERQKEIDEDYVTESYEEYEKE